MLRQRRASEGGNMELQPLQSARLLPLLHPLSFLQPSLCTHPDVGSFLSVGASPSCCPWQLSPLPCRGHRAVWGPHDTAGLVLAIAACFMSICHSPKPLPGKALEQHSHRGLSCMGTGSQQLCSAWGLVVIIHPSLLMEVGGAKEKTLCM